MISSLWRLICRFFRWLINLFKKKKKEEKKEIIKEDISHITPSMVLKGAVDVGMSIYNQNHEMKIDTVEDINRTVKNLKKNINSLTKENCIKEIAKVNERIKKVQENNKAKPIGTVEEIKKIENTNKQVKDILKELSAIEIINNERQDIIPEQNKNIIYPSLDLQQQNDKEELTKENKELEKQKDYIKTSNKSIKEINRELKDLTGELSLNLNSFKLDQDKIKIEELKSKAEKIKKAYYEFKNSDYKYVIENDFELNELDEYKMISSEEEIDLCLAKCDLLIRTINEKNNKKEEENKVSEDIKKEVTEEVSTKKQQSEENKEKINMDNIIAASNLVNNDIKRQNKNLNKMLNKISSAPVTIQRGKRLNFFDNFISNTFTIGLSLLPFKLIRNRPLALLVSGFILNNRIRSMRRIVTNVEVNYAELNRRAKTEIDIIDEYDTICSDSLYQISRLKEEFERTYGDAFDNPNVIHAYAKINTLEKQIINQQAKLQNTKEDIHQKVKQMERKYEE